MGDGIKTIYLPYRYGHPGYRYGIRANDMADDSIDTVISHINMGYLVTLPDRPVVVVHRVPALEHGGQYAVPTRPGVAPQCHIVIKFSKQVYHILVSSADTRRFEHGRRVAFTHLGVADGVRREAGAYTRPPFSSTSAVLVTPPRVPLSDRLGEDHTANVLH